MGMGVKSGPEAGPQAARAGAEVVPSVLPRVAKGEKCSIPVISMTKPRE